MLSSELEEWINQNLELGVARADILTLLIAEGLDVDDISMSITKCFLSIKDRTRSWVNSKWYPAWGQTEVFGGGGNLIYKLSHFLSEQECEELIEEGKKDLKPSTILGEDDPSKIRTSNTSQIGSTSTELISKIDKRICEALGLPMMFSEPLQLHYYESGTFFDEHTDYLPKNKLNAYDASFGQRSFSVLIYLNTVNSGGETSFSELNLTFSPELGVALVWNNIDENFQTKSLMKHSGEIVTNGFKAVLTKWFRLPRNTSLLCFPGEPFSVGKFSFKKGSTCPNLLSELKSAARFTGHSLSESVPEEFLTNIYENEPASGIIPIEKNLLNQFAKYASNIIFGDEKVAGRNVQLYGIRRYSRGAQLAMHFDRSDGSHDIGMILCVDQDTSQDWPLFIEDYERKLHKLVLSPGEYLIYRSSSLLHGRPKHLEGSHVCNLYAHFSFNQL